MKGETEINFYYWLLRRKPENFQGIVVFILEDCLSFRCFGLCKEKAGKKEKCGA